jgi:hypothetical protein
VSIGKHTLPVSRGFQEALALRLKVIWTRLLLFHSVYKAYLSQSDLTRIVIIWPSRVLIWNLLLIYFPAQNP